MKTLAPFFLLLSFLLSFIPSGTLAQDKVFLSSCYNSGSGVSYSFSGCVNRNFSQIQFDLGGFYSYCSNIGDEVSFTFLSCIQRNFQTAESEANGNLYLSYCSNFDRTTLSFSYVSCVNRNFSEIERFINTRQNLATRQN